VRWIAVLATSLAVLSVAAPAVPAAPRAPSPRVQAAERLNTLVRHTRRLPNKLAARHSRRLLVRLARSAKRSSRRNPCRSVRTLRTYRRGLRRVRRPRQRSHTPTTSSVRGQLESDTLAANVALLALPRARPCGGRRVTVTQARSDVLESDERHLRLRLSLPLPTFAAHQVGGSEYQQIFMEGAGETSDVGKPGLPSLAKLFAVPEGADVSVTVNDTTGYDLRGVNLYPHQPDPVDQGPGSEPPPSTFLEDPFVKSKRAYRSRRAFPAKPADAGVLGKMRDLRIGDVDLAGGRYKPKRRKLHVFTSLEVTVNFGGGNQGSFGDARVIDSPWEGYFTRNYERVMVNAGTAVGKLTVGPVKPFCGEDMLVVTSPALKPAADTFANARKAAGYHPRVVLVGSAPGQVGTTLAQIQAYILAELNADCEVRPSYVVLFGDTSHVPTWHPPCAEGGDPAECSIPSDLPYSLNFPSDLFADVMLGRIPAPNLDAANAVVSKIVGYETTSPAPPGDDFFTHTTVTAYFEQRLLCVLNEGESGSPNCKAKNGPVNGHYIVDYPNHRDGRGFTKTAESIRTAMVDAGLTVDRVYTKGADPQVIPEEYYDGTPIPDHLRLPGFPWDDDGNDLLDDYNAGRSLILHRDHGWHYGWSNPNLSTINVFQMNNGTQLPVVFGVDCSSATFDVPGSPSFVEAQVMKPDGGAFAGFGDTQVSPTWPNNHMAYGFFDAMFPDTQPSFGSEVASSRLGDVLLSGKGFMASQNSGAAEYQEHYLYHLLGDPSAQAWVATPVKLDVGKIDVHIVPVTAPQPGGPPFLVHVDIGDQGVATPTVVTLYHRGEAVGRGLVTKGAIDIVPEGTIARDTLVTAFEQDRALPAEKAVALR
jgi:hypothetical protein